jgi:hypothetical protein
VLDTGFNGTGIFMPTTMGVAALSAVTLDAFGRIIAVGSVGDTGQVEDIFVMRV